ncbi:DNA/RNA polymerase [Tricholoma matsutake]|nr:DNA/RNA polymerase [Tricholoma matsutake 945]
MASPSAHSWNGKAKAAEQDFDDINPTITYRHLHTQNLGVRDPLRVIALCDSDAFYAACEMVRLGTPKDTPLVVLQWNALIAVNYPARKYGISRLVKLKSLDDLKSKCPDLVIVHVATYKEGEKEPGYWDEVSLDYYRRESVKIAQLFKECLPGVEIEKASIDEAFFDFTKPVREILLERHPYLAHVPQEGLDTPLPPPPPMPWNGLGTVIPINPSGGKEDEDNIDTEVHQDSEYASMTWHDVALSIAAELMEKARQEVYTKLGYSTSAGIARNKFLAKLTASHKKPMNQSILRNAAIPQYLMPIPFQKIRFLGGKLGSALAKEFEASTVSDLLYQTRKWRDTDLASDEMRRKFGDDCLWIYEILRGIDRSEVKGKKVAVKSMLASKNLPKPVTDASDGFHWIRVLAAELALRLNDARKTTSNLWPKTLVLSARKGYEAGRSKQAPFPFTREVNVDTIAAAGDKLWKELVGTNIAMKVNNITLGFTGLESSEVGQRSIEGFLNGQALKRPRDEDDNAIDNIPSRSLDDAADHKLSFTCTRCGKTISSDALMSGVGTEEDLTVLRQEHDDFHFAHDLAGQQPSNDLVISGPSKAPPKISPKRKKRQKDPPSRGGIEQFFGRGAS